MIPRVNSSPGSALDRRRRSSDDVLHRVAVDRCDDVACLYPGFGRGRVRFHGRDEHPSFVPKYSASCGDRSSMLIPSLLPERQKKFSSDGGTARGGTAGAAETAVRAGIGGVTPQPVVPFEESEVVPFARRDAQADALAIAHHCSGHRAAGGGLRNEPRELPDAADAFAVELHDDVPFFQAGFRGGAILIDIVNQNSRVTFPLASSALTSVIETPRRLPPPDQNTSAARGVTMRGARVCP